MTEDKIGPVVFFQGKALTADEAERMHSAMNNKSDFERTIKELGATAYEPCDGTNDGWRVSKAYAVLRSWIYRVTKQATGRNQ